MFDLVYTIMHLVLNNYIVPNLLIAILTTYESKYAISLDLHCRKEIGLQD